MALISRREILSGDLSIRRTANRAIPEQQEDLETRRREIIEDHERKLARLRADVKKRESETRESGEAAVNHLRKATRSRLDDLRRQSDTNLDQERANYNGSLSRMQAQFRQASSDLQRDGEARFEAQSESSGKALEELKRRAVETEDAVEKEYQSEIHRVRKKAETELSSSKNEFTVKLNKQENTQDETLAESKRLHEEQNQDVNKVYKQKALVLAEQSEKNLAQKRMDFQTRFDRADKAQRASLTAQKERFLKHLIREQSKLNGQLEAHASRAQDPFYGMRDFDARLAELPDSYVLTAKVPEYEKDLVEVRVQPDKIVLTASRSNELRHDEDGVSASTNSHQTFRQEFPLSIPVAHDRSVQIVETDGSITVTVPKKGYSGRA